MNSHSLKIKEIPIKKAFQLINNCNYLRTYLLKAKVYKSKGHKKKAFKKFQYRILIKLLVAAFSMETKISPRKSSVMKNMLMKTLSPQIRI
jgi:hypothetical protein